jgi:hypothetical protein
LSDLPTGIWGLDEVGKEPGNEVPLFRYGSSTTISRAASARQLEYLRETHKIHGGHGFWISRYFLVEETRPSGRVPICTIRLNEDNRVKHLYGVENWNTPRARRLGPDQDARNAMKTFFLKWLKLDIEQIAPQPRLELGIPIFVDPVDGPWWKQGSNRITRPDIDILQAMWKRLHEEAKPYLRPRHTEQIGTGVVNIGLRLQEPATNRAVLVDNDVNLAILMEVGEDKILWRAIWEPRKLHFHISLSTRRYPGRKSQAEELFETLTPHETLGTALTSCGYMFTKGYDQWLEALPDGTPLVDIGFFKVFGKTLPPLASMEKFVPWAAKENLLPWSPLV